MSASSRKGPIVDPGLCRCCGALKKCRLLNVEYEWFGQKEVYSEMFVECFGLLLSHLEGEESERVICATCVVRLRDARAFRQQVLLCEEKLLHANIQVHEDKNTQEDEDVKNKVEVKVELEEYIPNDKVTDQDNEQDVQMNDGDDDNDPDYDAESLKSEPSEPVKKSPKKKKIKSKTKSLKRKKNVNGQCDEVKISKRLRNQECEYLQEIDSSPPEILTETQDGENADNSENNEESSENEENSEEFSENIEITGNALDKLPEKSKEKYLAAYENFILWRNTNSQDQSFSENVLLAYFNELKNKYKPSTLWCLYSMIKAIVFTKHGLDIKPYKKLTEFLKRRAHGFIGKKTKVLSPQDVDKFLKEAPDHQYLATKVALIFGITGACGGQELRKITTKDIEHHGKMILVKVTHTKNKIPRSFVIHGPFYDIVKKYENLRSTKATDSRFFQNYQKGKCTCQPIGVNKFGGMPKEIAKFLRLPDPESYTGHGFRRTSATLQNSSPKRRKRRSINVDTCSENSENDSANIEIESESKKIEPLNSENNLLEANSTELQASTSQENIPPSLSLMSMTDQYNEYLNNS